MSRSTDPGHFFQTDASEATRARKAAKAGNKNGNPIVFQSKILDVILDPLSEKGVYIAESAGNVRRVDIESRETKPVYKGPAAPLTSVAIGGPSANTVFAGCWDKDIWSWDRRSGELKSKYKGHSDFVKALLSVKISGKDLLVSGGADKKIIVWDTATAERIHTLQDKDGTMRAIQSLALDPVDTKADEAVFWSSSSDPHIRRWRVSLISAEQTLDLESTEPSTGKDVISEHATSVYKLNFDSDEGDLWTASADGTTKGLSRGHKWAAEETLEHGDYVRAVVVTSEWIITAGRNEDVKIWDRASGKLFHVYEGHYEEVTGLVLLDDDTKVASVSIDGTLRTWSLKRNDLEKAIKEKEEEANGVVKDTKPAAKQSLMTEEEEAELAELLDED